MCDNYDNQLKSETKSEFGARFLRKRVIFAV